MKTPQGITHKVVQKILFRSNNTEVVNDRGAWKDFDSANKQAISIMEKMTSWGAVEVHELIAGTTDTKRIEVRYVVEIHGDGSKLMSPRTPKMRIEIP